MRRVASALILSIASASHAGPSPVTIRVRPADGTGPVVVGKTVRVDVTIRGQLPSNPLRWTLAVQKREVASGDIGGLEDGTPIRSFHILTRVDHRAFALGVSPVGTTFMGGRPESLVRDIDLELLVHENEDDDRVIVATARMIVKATCEAGDRDPACR